MSDQPGYIIGTRHECGGSGRIENGGSETIPTPSVSRVVPPEPDRSTWLKIRTWEAIQGRYRAGDSAESLAEDYGVPLEWIRFVLFPENDLDARYARPSDRTKTMRARAEAAEAELALARQHIASTGLAYQQAQLAADEATWQLEALRAALRDLIDAIPAPTLDADPPLRVWVDAAEKALEGK